MSTEQKERDLEEQAVAEILKEASRGKEREKTLGTDGWRKPVARPNKIFIGRSLASAIRQTRYGEKAKSRGLRSGLSSDSRTNNSTKCHSKLEDKESKPKKRKRGGKTTTKRKIEDYDGSKKVKEKKS